MVSVPKSDGLAEWMVLKDKWGGYWFQFTNQDNRDTKRS